MPSRLLERGVQKRRAEAASAGRVVDRQVCNLALPARKPGHNITEHAGRRVAIRRLLPDTGEVHPGVGEDVAKGTL